MSNFLNLLKYGIRGELSKKIGIILLLSNINLYMFDFNTNQILPNLHVKQETKNDIRLHASNE